MSNPDKTSPAAGGDMQDPGRPFAITPDELSDAQRALIQRMEAGPRGRVPINQRIWMHNMPFAEVAERFGAYVSAEAPIGGRAKEICILVVAAYWDSAFEWHWHESAARKLGISASQIQAIRDQQDPGFELETEQVTFEVACGLLRRRDIPDALYQRAERVLGRNGVLDLIGLMALYGMIAQTIVYFRVRVPQA